MRKSLLTMMSVLAVINMSAHSVDFDQIRHWTGTGPNRAALVVTNDAGASDPKAYVWGYRWEDGENPTGEDMFKAICSNSSNLVLLTQTTGIYGSTVCGIGVGNADKLLQYIYFDFEKALDYEFINFDYYNTNSFFGQKEAPGDRTPEICAEAVDYARTAKTHFIQHPIDQPHYGYPAYDYDCWDMTDDGWKFGWWTSAWYSGYWSYWTVTGNNPDWMYSGTGFTGRQLSDGCIDGWSFTQFEDPKVGGVGEGVPPTDNKFLYVYCEPDITTGVMTIHTDTGTDVEYYTLTGIRVSEDNLTPGIYVIRSGNTVEKRYIMQK